MSHVCIIYAYSSFGTKTLIWHSCSVIVSGAGSGVRAMTNQNILSIQERGLKDKGAEWSVSDRVGTT